MQTERQQQTFAGAKNHRTEHTGIVNQASQTVNTSGEEWPDQWNDKTDQTEHHGSDNRYKTGAAKECQRIRQADGVVTFMQDIHNHTDNHRAQNTGIDRLNAEDHLNVVSFEDHRVDRRQRAVGSQIEVDRQIQYRITDEAGERGHAFVFTRHTQRDSDSEHHRQEAEGERTYFAHPGEDQLQDRITERWQQRGNVMAA